MFFFTCTEQVDYEAIAEELLFEPLDARLCINVTILDDLTVEPVQSFLVLLSSTDPGVMVAVGSAIINIQPDNDSEQHQNL